MLVLHSLVFSVAERWRNVYLCRRDEDFGLASAEALPGSLCERAPDGMLLSALRRCDCGYVRHSDQIRFVADFGVLAARQLSSVLILKKTALLLVALEYGLAVLEGSPEYETSRLESSPEFWIDRLEPVDGFGGALVEAYD